MLKTKAGAIIRGGREPDTIIRRHQLKAVVGLSIGHIYELVAQGKFPKPIKLGPRGDSGWLSREVEEWQQCPHSRTRRHGCGRSVGSPDCA